MHVGSLRRFDASTHRHIHRIAASAASAFLQGRFANRPYNCSPIVRQKKALRFLGAPQNLPSSVVL
jgi:hypothetical protein